MNAVKDLQGRIAFVTGGASGLGLGMTKAFLERGMSVVVADVMPDHLDAAQRILPDDGRCHFVRLDVTDRKATVDVARDVEGRIGPISVLCNNAGIGLLGGIAETEPESWDWVTAVNYTGVFNGIHAFLPGMRARGEGHIVNTSSIGGVLPGPGAAAYLAAKAGIFGLSEALYCDLRAEGIGVTVILLGPTASNIHDVTKQMAAQRGPAAAERGDMAELNKPIIAGGMDPVEAGRMVASAIEKGRLYLFTHREFRHAVRQHFDAIMTGFGPDDDAPPVTECYGFPTFNPLFAEILVNSMSNN